jgi:hypothetical protein
MSAKSIAILLIAALTVGGAATGDGVRRYHARPQQRCGIPAAPYQPPQPPPVVAPVLAISQVGHLITLPPPAQTDDTAMSLKIAGRPAIVPPRVKLYQFTPTVLQIDHCSISRIAMTIDENGHWRLNLRADQNPYAENPGAVVTVPAKVPRRIQPALPLKQTTHLKRNLFVIQVRGLGASSEPLATPPSPSALGKPVLLSIGPIEFLVQRSVPYAAVFEDVNRDAAIFFDLIDRVEIEFSYR